MLSLDNTYTREEIAEFAARIAKGNSHRDRWIMYVNSNMMVFP